MATLNAKQLLNNLYGLMMEINYHKPDEEIMSELEALPDTQIEKHIIRIKQLSAKLKAEENKQKFNKAIEQINELRKKGIEELRKLLSTEDQLQLRPLFRKFEEITSEDEASIIEDQELLRLIEILNKRINESEDD